MKITGVRARPYEIQLRRRIADANNPIGYDRMAGLAVQLDTDAGVTGVALSSPGLHSHITGMVDDQLVGRELEVPQGGYLEVNLGGPTDRVVLVRPPFEYAG